jgi:hypothetical protein
MKLSKPQIEALFYFENKGRQHRINRPYYRTIKALYNLGLIDSDSSSDYGKIKLTEKGESVL